MEKKNQKTGKKRFSLSDRIRVLCGAITPGKRLLLILPMLGLCTAANVYFLFMGVYRMGRDSVLPESGRIDPPGLVIPDRAAGDTIRQLPPTDVPRMDECEKNSGYPPINPSESYG